MTQLITKKNNVQLLLVFNVTNIEIFSQVSHKLSLLPLLLELLEKMNQIVDTLPLQHPKTKITYKTSYRGFKISTNSK